MDRAQKADPILLNGTGMPETDKLLLGLMAGQNRKNLFAKAGIPAAFTSVESCFWHPVFSGQPEQLLSLNEEVLEALEQLLWQWKALWPENGILISLG